MLAAPDLQHIANVAKECAETVMFASFSNPHWSQLFDIYLQNIFLPIIAFTFLINLYKCWQDFLSLESKGFDDYRKLILMTAGAFSIVSAITIKLLGLGPALVPTLFLTSLVIGLSNTSLSLIANLMNVTYSDDDDQKTHYQQAVIENLTSLVTLTFICGTVLSAFVLAAPPIVNAIFATSASIASSANAFWRCLSEQQRQDTKSALGYSKSYYLNDLDYDPDEEVDTLGFTAI